MFLMSNKLWILSWILLGQCNGQSLYKSQEKDDFVAGDGRCQAHSTILAMHVIWFREHNRIANALGPLLKHYIHHLDEWEQDEIIFQNMIMKRRFSDILLTKPTTGYYDPNSQFATSLAAATSGGSRTDGNASISAGSNSMNSLNDKNFGGNNNSVGGNESTSSPIPSSLASAVAAATTPAAAQAAAQAAAAAQQQQQQPFSLNTFAPQHQAAIPAPYAYYFGPGLQAYGSGVYPAGPMNVVPTGAGGNASTQFQKTGYGSRKKLDGWVYLPILYKKLSLLSWIKQKKIERIKAKTHQLQDLILQVLKRMGLSFGLENGNVGVEDLAKARAMVPRALEQYVIQLAENGPGSCVGMPSVTDPLDLNSMPPSVGGRSQDSDVENQSELETDSDVDVN
ncbi:unnamed protein product [Lepeophtheirus salmonis]|uniref:(salmon louse) hypothetical protein n=1 Tax=Lepeophtheirus salmonis TaxID=72036 RepID=A0A7R8CN62_LEPSM|nr:unnamed protein product [Lepeophtheirus salmonis]CAF2843269.1 unnamed protein product [Lepeophtheirus salmonis]